MPAFLKRRWILLSCAMLLLACSFVELSVHWTTGIVPAAKAHFLEISGGMISYRDPGIKGREYDVGTDLSRPPSLSFVSVGAPSIGAGFCFESDCIGIPLWLPLAVIVGWIVFRELRWREKRTKAADAREINAT